MGDTQLASGDLQGALKLYDQARQIRSRMGMNTLETHDGAMLLTKIGHAHAADGNLGEAFRAYNDAIDVRHAAGIFYTSEGANLMKHLAVAKADSDDISGAIECYETEKDIRIQTGTLESRDGARMMTSIGLVKRTVGDLDGALDSYMEARRILAGLGPEGLETQEGAALLMRIGVA